MVRVRTYRGGGQVLPLVESDQTASRSVSTPPAIAQSTQVVAAILTSEADGLRSQYENLGDEVDNVHEQTYLNEWHVRSGQHAESSSRSLLSHLADFGFAWRDIARLVGVSVPAIQKWRKGGSTTADNRQRLAALVAACDVIQRHRSIEDIAQWFEMDVVRDVHISVNDLWSANEYELVFEYALQGMAPEQVLDRFEPDWREKYSSNFETYRAGDGQLSIRAKG